MKTQKHDVPATNQPQIDERCSWYRNKKERYLLQSPIGKRCATQRAVTQRAVKYLRRHSPAYICRLSAESLVNIAQLTLHQWDHNHQRSVPSVSPEHVPLFQVCSRSRVRYPAGWSATWAITLRGRYRNSKSYRYKSQNPIRAWRHCRPSSPCPPRQFPPHAHRSRGQ